MFWTTSLSVGNVSRSRETHLSESFDHDNLSQLSDARTVDREATGAWLDAVRFGR